MTSQPKAPAELLDLVVVGAGWFGIAAAKTFRQLHPGASFAVLDAAATLGGVWAEHRLYPGLKSNNMLGTYEYPDMPMDSATYGVQPGQHIPGAVIHRYLTDYATKFGVAAAFRNRTKVLSAELCDEGGWTLSLLTDGDNGESSFSTLAARKLIVATGLTSEPFLPHFAGQETFGGPIFHSRDFLQHADSIETAKNITVFGGTKSAWDIAYAYASKGVTVNMIIRSTGHGPIWQAPPYVTPLKKWLEKLVMTRMLTWFSPCIWGDSDGYAGVRGFYSNTAVGRSIANTFWSILGGDVVMRNKYDSHPETAKLKPWSPAMFTASSFSILNYETDFFELVRNGSIRIHIAEIAKLEPGLVHLTDGTLLTSDALACATGWKHVPPMTFLPEGVEKDLGMPHVVAANADADEPIVTTAALDRADNEILRRYPRLRQQPVQNKNLKPITESGGVSSSSPESNSPPTSALTPWTLYRFVVPPTERFLQRRDIAFAGVIMNFSIPTIAHVQALWINAFFDGALSPSVLPLLPKEAVAAGEDPQKAKATLEKLRYDTLLYSRFGKWRYPAGHGSQFPDFVFDALPYLDWLVGDLGLRVHRKGGWLSEATTPYGPEDYRNLVAEWQAKQAKTIELTKLARLMSQETC